MKSIKKLTVVTLSALLLGTSSLPLYAQDDSSKKEEVIYVLTDASGSVNDIEVVNIFKGGNITDYGNYTNVKMLNTTDQINQDGDKITFNSSVDKVYYQGTLTNKSIPWNISIKYYLDGKEYSASDLAGKSGNLEIRFVVSENTKCKDSFYDNYALQASFTLDSDKCKNIKAEGATLANVGSDKQITYTILPGKGIDTTIKADVSDFEMEAVAINGVRLSLNIDIDDAELMDKVDEIVSAIIDLNDGSKEINDGTKKLYDATNTLNSKVNDLNTGVGSLNSGASDLYSGLSQIASNNDQLNKGAYTAFEGLCTLATTTLNAQLKEKGMEEVSLTPETYSEVLTGLLKQLDADTVYSTAYAAAKETVSKQVEEKADEVYKGYIDGIADSIYFNYVANTYVNQNAQTIYSQYVSKQVYNSLLEQGKSEEEAKTYLESDEGKKMIAEGVDKLTEDQKTAILNGALESLTDEQKKNVLENVEKLTDEQKSQIKNTYIEQMMVSDDVTSQITAAVKQASQAAGIIAELKGSLDNYALFCNKLGEYTGSVSKASEGAKSLKTNMDTLYSNTGTLKNSVSELNDAVGKLYDGTKDLSSGTSEFKDKTSNMDNEISDQIDSMISSISGDGEVVSFVSDKNTKVESVQFVIKTEAIEKAEDVVDETVEESTMTFIEKLLNLFGLN